jgi:RNA polymerase sigma-70 factor (ECF subfamily)
VTDDGPNEGVIRPQPPGGRDAEPLRAGLAEAAPAVRRFLFGLCGDWHRSEDLSQEALLKAWQGRASFDGRADLGTWVFAIARNHWLSSLRQQARRPREKPMIESAQVIANARPDAEASRGELTQAVARALARLPDEQREVLALRESGGLTFAEAAAVLGVPVATAKSRARYGLLKLAEELEPFRQELES